MILPWKRCLTKEENKHSIVGDVEEDFKDTRLEKGFLIAHLWFWLQVLISIPSFLKHNIYWSVAMYKNYLKIALRNLIKHKSCSIINISGLAIGMACCILIMLWVQDEYNYDRFQTTLVFYLRSRHTILLKSLARRRQSTIAMGPHDSRPSKTFALAIRV